jgi:hypothetical protein
VRVLILGGTRFIGRRIAADLVARGDEVTVVHRGETETAEPDGCTHLHSDRGGEPVPISEESPVREGRYPLRDLIPGLGEQYDKLFVEPGYLGRGGTALRLAISVRWHLAHPPADPDQDFSPTTVP